MSLGFLVSIQNIRKTSDFDVTDKIYVHIENHDIIRDAINKYSDYIKSEVLATDIVLDDADKGEPVEITEDVQRFSIISNTCQKIHE